MAKVLKTKNVVAGVHYTTKHTGKMAGLCGISTSVTLNPICQQRIKDGASICSHCFSQRMWNPENGIYRKQRACYEENFRILTTHLLEGDELPEFDPVKVPLVRIESFGDVATVTQARNYLRRQVVHDMPAMLPQEPDRRATAHRQREAQVVLIVAHFL